MKKSMVAVLSLALLAMACAPKQEAPSARSAAPAPTGPCELNLFIWSEYMDPEILASFEQKYSCKVTTSLYESNEDMVAKLQGGSTSLYDVVVPGQYMVQVMSKLGLIQPLNHANIPNIENLDETFADPVYDRGNKYSVAYQWGTVGIYMRKKAGESPEPTWGLLFDKAKQPGPFLLIDSSREMLGTVLKYQGKSVNTVSIDELKAARDVLVEAKARSQGFEGGVGGKNKVRSQDVAAAVVYNGDAEREISGFPETVFFLPKEGGVVWVDNLAIPAKAPHLDAAEKFINYILDPKIGAQLSNYNQFATPNKAAKEFINPEDLAKTTLYPTAEEMAKLEFIEDLGNNNQLYDEIWTQVKSQ